MSKCVTWQPCSARRIENRPLPAPAWDMIMFDGFMQIHVIYRCFSLTQNEMQLPDNFTNKSGLCGIISFIKIMGSYLCAGDSPGYIEKQFAVLYACPPIRCFDWGRYTYTSAFYSITKRDCVFDFIIIFRELQNI